MKLLLPLILTFCASMLVFSQQSATPDPPQKASVVFAEAETKDGKKVLLMTDGTWTFSQSIIPESKPSPSPNPVAPSGPPITATPEDVALFPLDYDGKLIKFSRVRISEVRMYSEANQNIYLVDARSAQGKFFSNIMSAGDLKFGMWEDLARKLQSEYQSSGKGQYTEFVVNIVVEFKVTNEPSGQRWITALIRCIEFQNYSGKTTKWIGNCN